MTQTKEEKAAYMREYRKTYNLLNKEKLRAQAKRYYHKNKSKIKDYAKEYYKNNIDRMNAKNTIYRLTHRDQINEWSRHAYYKRRGRPLAPKGYSFYRDFIKAVDCYPNKIVRTTIFRALLALPLTTHQKKLVSMTFSGMTQPQIAEKLGVNQTTICHQWNGTVHHITFKWYGGIYKKFLKYLAREEQFAKYLEGLGLRWSKEASHGKTSQKPKISISNRRVSRLG